MSYVGQTLPVDRFSGYLTETFTGDGSTTAFTLTREPHSESAIIVVINNVVQQPVEDYTVSGTTLTIDAAVASGDVIYATHTGGVLPITESATIDLQGVSDALVLDSDADTTISADTDDQIDFKLGGVDEMTMSSTGIVINEGSNDRDFRIESNGNANMLFVSGGNDVVGIGAEGDLGVGLHIKTADSSGDVHATGDELVLENSGDCGMTILSGTSNHGRISFGDSGDNNIGYITYDHGSNAMSVVTNASTAMTISSAGEVTKPLQPAFSVKANATQSNIGDSTTILFGAETFDIGSNFASDHTFTAPVTGKYQLNVGIRIDNLDITGDPYHAVTIKTSNRDYYHLTSSNVWDSDANYYFFSISVLADMDASDTAYIVYNENCSQADQSDVNDSSYFSGFLVC